MTRDEFNNFNEKIESVIFGPLQSGERNFEKGEFFNVWRYRSLQEVKELCPDREARNVIRRWVLARNEALWAELGFPPISDDWNYWQAK
tara:strand:- start:113 stop:379 length:267 start_codon:yes stop_codon:yes gene_type:complete